MTVAAPSTTPLFAVPPGPVRRFTVDEYHRMIEGGILTSEDRVELLEGWIVPKMPHNPRHDGTIQLAAKAIGPLLPAGWELRIQSAITLDDSEPEPDVVVAAGTERTYLDRHPGPADIALVIEVADSSLAQDRGAKQRLYARAGLAEYWIVNLVEGDVEVYSEPSGSQANPAFLSRQTHRAGGQVPLVVGGHELARIAVRFSTSAPDIATVREVGVLPELPGR